MPEGRHSERHCIDPHVAGAGVETKSRQVKPLAHSWHELIQIAAVPCGVALENEDHARARGCIGKAVSTVKGFEVPLATWRAHATAAHIEEEAGWCVLTFGITAPRPGLVGAETDSQPNRNFERTSVGDRSDI